MESSIAISAMRLQGQFCDVRNSGPLRNSQTVRMKSRPVIDAPLIRRRLEELRKKPVDLARHLGIDAAKVSKMLSGERQVQVNELESVIEFLELSKQETVKPQDFAPLPMPDLRDKVPVMGTSQGGTSGWSLYNGEAVDHVQRPPSLANAPHGYATYVNGTSMEPRYYEGELVYAHPGRPVTSGCFVIVQMKIKQEGEPPPAII